MKPLPQTKTTVEQNGKGGEIETVSASDVLPAAFYIPRFYTGSHRKTTQMPRGSGEKLQILSAALGRPLMVWLQEQQQSSQCL